MRLDASRYSLFCTNPEEFRLRYIWNHSTSRSGGDFSLRSFGRRRGSAFHEMSEGADDKQALAKAYGTDAVKTADLMNEANEAYNKQTAVNILWREKEFVIPIPDSPHEMMGRVDCMAERPHVQPFILDFKTTKYRTKDDFAHHCEKLRMSPQVDFYLLAHPEVTEFIYRVLLKMPATTKRPAWVRIAEISATRQPFELKAMQRSVHMACETIEFWKREFGIEKPWPRAITLPVSWDMYGYASIYQRDQYEGCEWEGFEKRQEHLDCMREPDDRNL
jgi:hypothetical protein